MAKQYAAAPEMVIDTNKHYTATIATNLGNIEVDLYAKQAPKTVNNFVFLARDGYYANVPFHRIIKNFMVQTGDPTGTGMGGPGYRFADELPGAGLDYTRGTLAMANAGPNTNGSQFFLCHADLRGTLPKNYSIFGTVTGGLEVLDQIASVPVTASRSGERSQPMQDLRITSVTIRE